jgi:hypothetical protein
VSAASTTNFVGQLLLLAAGAQGSGIEVDAQHLSALYYIIM